MLNKVEDVFRQLLACLQVAQLYTVKHRLFGNSLDKAYISLIDFLKEGAEFTIGIVGEELVFETEIFFDLSKAVRPAIMYLKDRGIEKMVFFREVTKEELEKFIIILAAPKEERGLTAQERLLFAGIKNIRAGKIKTETSPAAEDDRLNRYKKLYDSSMDNTLHTVTDILDSKSIDRLALQFTVTNLMDNLTQLPHEFMKLVAVRRHDSATYSHLLNVSILSMFFSSKLGFSKEDILEMGISALFHDIGKLYISRKILDKPEHLTQEEFQAVKSHTLLGAEILLNYQDALGILPVVVAFEHHLKYDLSGYPKFPNLKKPHLASSIVSVCDVFDALYQRRGYKVDYSPDIIYRIMNAEKNTTFEPELLDNFFKAVGVWPIGSIVELSDGRIAVVREQDKDDIFLPKVEVIAPADRIENISLKDRQASIKILRFLSPWKEGKDYLGMI